MHNLDLILTLTLGLSVALIFGYVTQRIGLSPRSGPPNYPGPGRKG